MKTSKYRTASGDIITVEIADTFFTRFCGLMLRRGLPKKHGLLLAPCSSIHMLFMRFSIDAIYIDKDFCIQKIVKDLRPWIGISACFSAWGVIEFPAGTAEKFHFLVGQKFCPIKA